MNSFFITVFSDMVAVSAVIHTILHTYIYIYIILYIQTYIHTYNTTSYIPYIIYYPRINAMTSRILKPTLYFYILYPPLP
jgi:hypothetical protein